MGNTCQLPLLTTAAPEMAAGCVKSSDRRCRRQSFCESAQFCTIRRASPQDVHRNATLSSCGKGRFGAKLITYFEHRIANHEDSS
jgi:hypothetical protein